MGFIASFTPHNHAVEGLLQAHGGKCQFRPGFTADWHPAGDGSCLLPGRTVEI